MENQERDMGPDGKGEKEIAGRSKNKERLIIMIFKEVGKVRRFTVSSRLILCGVALFLLYIVVTIYFTNKYLAYFYIYKTDKIQADEIAELRAKNIKKDRELERSKLHIALLDDYIKEGKEQSPEPMTTTGDYTESSLPKLVSVEELKVRRDRSTINIAFRIVNKQSDDEPIGGYIFILTSIKDSDRSEVWVYPSSPLKNGLPVNYRQGKRFLIQRFKSISSEYRLGKLTDKPLILEILVYNRDGELILKKVVEV